MGSGFGGGTGEGGNGSGDGAGTGDGGIGLGFGEGIGCGGKGSTNTDGSRGTASDSRESKTATAPMSHIAIPTFICLVRQSRRLGISHACRSSRFSRLLSPLSRSYAMTEAYSSLLVFIVGVCNPDSISSVVLSSHFMRS